MIMILKYLETPQFLRRRLFPKMNDLKFAGVLQPLKIASHITPSNSKKINRGDIREGIVVSVKGKKFVDVGINQLIEYYGNTSVGKRITVQFKEGYPKLSIKEIEQKRNSIILGIFSKRKSKFVFNAIRMERKYHHDIKKRKNSYQ